MTATIPASHVDVSGACVLSIINPATEQVLKEVPISTREEFGIAVAHALEAVKSWTADADRRRTVLRQCSETLRKRRNAFELATILTEEQGKPKREALAEVYAAAHWFSKLADLKIPIEEVATEYGVAVVQREPVGIVGAITSWNFPIFLAASKIASALLTGNAVILKPSPFTPLATLRLAELLTGDGSDSNRESIPAGVLTVLIGDSEPGRWLVESTEIGHVSFTGSVEVGKTLLRNAVEPLKSTTLELGGNDAAIVLADVDVDQILEPLFWGAFTNAGQFCTGIKRLYVQEPVFERVVNGLADLARKTIVGDGLNPKTQMGPLANVKQYSRVIQLVDEIKSSGATIVAGGEPLGRPGYYVPPTIVIDVADDDPIVRDEQFGPILPIISFCDFDEVVERANSTSFGLGASIWSRNNAQIEGLATRLDCGTVWINGHGVLDPMVPFGGRKFSGMGYENGLAGVCEFTKLRIVHRVSRQ